MSAQTTDESTPAPAPGRRNRTLTELAAEQGITGPQDFDALFGAGADLWDDDADFEAFVAGLRIIREAP